jgi:hypothetical protein
MERAWNQARFLVRGKRKMAEAESGSRCAALLEGHVEGEAVGTLLPAEEELDVRRGDVITLADVEELCSAVDPLGCAFDFSDVADGGAVDYNVSGTVSPFCAIFLIAEGWAESERDEDVVHLLPIFNRGFMLNASLMTCPRVAAGFVRELPVISIEAEAEDLSGTTKIADGVVVKRIGFESRGGLLGESRALQVAYKRGWRMYQELDFDFATVGCAHFSMTIRDEIG